MKNRLVLSLLIAAFCLLIAVYTKTTSSLDSIDYYNRGTKHISKNNYNSAIENFTKAIKIDPDYADAYYTHGTVYYWQEDYDNAIEDYNQAIRINPNLFEAYTYRGTV